jgi:abortive infection bacteriophage resistance protein
MKYTKPPLSLADQINLLQSRGMSFADTVAAESALASLNYYRLSAYWLPFETVSSGKSRTHQFRSGATFEQCLALYNFDIQLRQICFAGVKKIELALRSQFAHQMSMLHGSHYYLSNVLFESTRVSKSGRTLWSYSGALSSLQNNVQTSHEIFIKHYLNTYSDPAGFPPVWMAVELMSIGDLSRWFKYLKQPGDRQNIADYFGVGESVLATAIHHFSVVRNICAHHGRLWNRELVVPLKYPSKPTERMRFSTGISQNRIHNSCMMLAYLLRNIDTTNSWAKAVKESLRDCPLPVKYMGFEAGWENFWPWNVC